MRDDETSVRTVHAERRRLSALFEELTPELSRSRFRRVVGPACRSTLLHRMRAA
jgi:hypothetical protein